MPSMRTALTPRNSAGERQADAHADAPREQPEAEAGDRRGQREGADDGCRERRAQAALDEVRRLVQADAGLHGKDRRGVEREQPERRRAQRLPARERRLGGARGAALCSAGGSGIAVARAVGQQSDILRPPHQQQPGRHEADQQHGAADRQPPGAPAVLLDGEMGDERQRDQARHLRQVDDRAWRARGARRTSC